MHVLLDWPYHFLLLLKVLSCNTNILCQFLNMESQSIQHYVLVHELVVLTWAAITVEPVYN